MLTVTYTSSFMYRDHGNGPFPTLQVEIVNAADPSLRVNVDAYLDTGASRSVFFGWIPEAIGLNILDGQPLSYVNNMGQSEDGRILSVIINHPDLGEFPIDIGFAMWNPSRSLLGRDFLNLIQVGFRESQFEFHIEASP
jgi:hypothetical protein